MSSLKDFLVNHSKNTRQEAFVTRDLEFVSNKDLKKISHPKNISETRRSQVKLSDSPENTLDNVLILYNGTTQAVSRGNQNQVSRDLSLMISTAEETVSKKQEGDENANLVTLKDFISIKPEELSPEEQKLQEALKILHHLNDRDPPLYKSFPNWRPNQPITIDATTMPSGYCSAAFLQDDNLIQFNNNVPTSSLLGMIAHELKHAEQYSEEVYQKARNNNGNNKEAQKIRFTEEAQSYAFEAYVQMLAAKEQGDNNWELACNDGIMRTAMLPIVKKHKEKDPDLKDVVNLQEELMIGVLPCLYYSDYKTEYDGFQPIKGNEADITSLPESFHLSNEFVQNRLLGALKQMPLENREVNPERLETMLSLGKIDEANKILEKTPKSAKSFVVDFARDLFLFSAGISTDMESIQELNWFSKHSKLPFRPNGVAKKLTDAINQGQPYLAQALLQLKDSEGKRVLNPQNLASALEESLLFQQESATDKITSNEKKMKQMQISMTGAVLFNLKDENGNYIITADDLKQMQGIGDPNHVLEDYQKAHSEDTRFNFSKESDKKKLQKILTERQVETPKPKSSLIITQKRKDALQSGG